MVRLRFINSKVRPVVIAIISVFMVDYIAILKDKILRYNRSCKPLSLPPRVIARILKGCEITGFRAVMFDTIPPSCSMHFRRLTAEIALIFNSCRSFFSLTRIYSLISKYLPYSLPADPSNGSNLSAGKMLNGVKSYYILWFKAAFSSLVHNVLLLVYNDLKDIYHKYYGLSIVSLHNTSLPYNYYHTLNTLGQWGNDHASPLRLFRASRVGGERDLDESLWVKN